MSRMGSMQQCSVGSQRPGLQGWCEPWCRGAPQNDVGGYLLAQLDGALASHSLTSTGALKRGQLLYLGGETESVSWCLTPAASARLFAITRSHFTGMRRERETQAV